MAAEGPATTDAPAEAAVDRGAHGADDDTGEPSHQTGHTVLVGYGQVGRIVAAGIKADGGGLVVIEDSDHDVAAARAEGFEVVFGNAASQDVLKLANLAQAKALLVAISNGFEAGSVCESGRKLNPGIAIISRAYSEEEEDFLRGLGATTVIRGEQEIGKGILAYLRSDASKQTSGIVLPEEPKLPTAENILTNAAMGAALTEAALSEAPKAEAAEVVAEEGQATEDNSAEEAAEPAVDTGKEIAVIETAEVVVPEAVTAEPVDEVIILPPAEVVAIEATPSVGEAPAEIDEIVTLPTADENKPADAGEAAEAIDDASGEGVTDAAETTETETAPEGAETGSDELGAVPDVKPEPKN